MKIRSREAVLKVMSEFFAPHFVLKYNPNLKNEAQDREHMKRPGQYIHDGAGPQSDPVLGKTNNQMIFGVFMSRDGKTIEYDDDSRLLFIIHEVAHMICTRRIYDFDKYSPDLYGWVNEFEKKDPRYYHWSVMEEMTAGFIGFIWQAKMGIIFDLLFHDATVESVSQTLNFPNKFLDFTGKEIPTKLKTKLDKNNKLWMACDSDLSPLFRLAKENWTNDNINQMVLNNDVFRQFGIRHHMLLGAVDGNGNIIGRLTPETVKRNNREIVKLWKVLPAEEEDFIGFYML
jgi:hypothetical protein